MAHLRQSFHLFTFISTKTEQFLLLSQIIFILLWRNDTTIPIFAIGGDTLWDYTNGSGPKEFRSRHTY